MSLLSGVQPPSSSWKPSIKIIGWNVLITLGIVFLSGVYILHKARESASNERDAAVSAAKAHSDTAAANAKAEAIAAAKVEADRVQKISLNESNTALRSLQWRVVEAFGGKITREKGALQEIAVSFASRLYLTDSQLAILAGCPEITKLDLSQSAKVTTAEVIKIVNAKLPSLRELDLAHTAVDDGAVEHLCKLEKLTTLSLTDSKITKPESFVTLTKGCQNLERLNLANCKFTSDMKKPPPPLQLYDNGKLNWLNLDTTQFRKEWLADLKQLKSLKTLWIKNGNPDCQAPAAGPLMKALQDALPELTIK
jgi:hypothetical protein